MASKSKRSKFAKNKSVKHYDDKLCLDLANIIEILTHSGSKIINQHQLNEMKNICKRSDNYVKEAFNMVMETLKENHAEVRFSALQICDEMFRRSHCFREVLVSNLEHVVELTMGKTLPPPSRVARELQELAVRSLHQWNATFGQTYKKLGIGYAYLRRTEKAAFKILDETPSQEASIQRQELINNMKSKKILAEMKDKEMDIKTTVTSMSNCINLLLPHPDNFFIVSEEDGDQQEAVAQDRPTESARVPSNGCDIDGEEDLDNPALREVGISGVNHSVELDFVPSSEVYIKETPENVDIIQNLKDVAKLVKNKYLPTVNTWLETLRKTKENKEEERNLMTLKGDMDDVVFKYSRMIFVSGDDVSSDSELEEVEEAKPPISSDNHSKDPDHEIDPVKSEPSTSGEAESRKAKLLAIAPKRPFDVDLYHWEDEKLPVPTMIPSSTEGHRFWVAADSSLEEIPVPEGSVALRTRVIEFTGDFAPVSHTCRVRLPSGKLCPRRDRYKCPFHGEIVPRDEAGSCINPQDAIRMQQLVEKRQQEKPDWQNPKLLADLKRTTGIDLKMPEKGKRKKKEKYPGLTDLKKLKNNAKSRLEKKIFKKSSMKRVATAMDRVDQRKFTDKFGDQFNYFYS